MTKIVINLPKLARFSRLFRRKNIDKTSDNQNLVGDRIESFRHASAKIKQFRALHAKFIDP